MGSIKTLFSREYTHKRAVDHMSFSVDRGEVVGYIGPNGAGKSTTIKMMTGILVPTSGNIQVDGITPYEQRQKNAMNIGVVFGQRTQLWWDLPVRETFSILKEIYNVNDADYKKRMSFLGEVLELEPFLATPVRSLSLGQRMRADLAAAMIHNPKVLYLDEPTIGLDVVVKENVRQAIKQLNAEFNTTVILTTHDLSDIEELCKRIIIIDNGRKVYDGTLAEIKSRFGTMRRLELKVKNPYAFKAEPLRAKYGLSGDELSCEVVDGQLNIELDRNRIGIQEVINEVLAKTELVDMSLFETKIEEIIKKIYRNEVNME
jgi:ABC-2 type transport system ATP-binding protein